MTDIVERLRARKATWQNAIIVMEESADEIERLQAENQDLIVSNTTLDKSNLEMRAELERLRAQTDTSIKDQIIAGHIDNFMKQQAEIERLRALKTPAARQWLNTTKAALDSAEDEIERLRAALEPFAAFADRKEYTLDDIDHGLFINAKLALRQLTVVGRG